MRLIGLDIGSLSDHVNLNHHINLSSPVLFQALPTVSCRDVLPYPGGAVSLDSDA